MYVNTRRLEDPCAAVRSFSQCAAGLEQGQEGLLLPAGGTRRVQHLKLQALNSSNNPKVRVKPYSAAKRSPGKPPGCEETTEQTTTEPFDCEVGERV